MTVDPARLAWAAGAVLLWLLLVALTVWGVERARRWTRERAAALAGQAGDDGILIAYASQTGLAEELAWAAARMVDAAGAGARIMPLGDVTAAMLAGADRALFVVSTTGEGDPPDNAARFVRTLMRAPTALPDLRFGLLSLGDREYKDFCGFGRALEAWLRASGAEPLFDTVEVDDADPAAIRHWQHQVGVLTGSTAEPDWTPQPYGRWRLADRRLLNPGSPGGEAWAVTLEPLEDKALAWSAGDVAEIGVPTPDGQTVSREYSIASLPSDGRVELLVRLMHRPDGSPGLASGWLTRTLAIGDEVPLRLRINRAFHGPEPAAPMILIGNGTGIAGLRAHLRARALEAETAGTWLMFGERTRAHDAFYDDELRAWRDTGVLTRLDRAFSRDPGDGRYVQALVEAAGPEIADWVGREAAIYVCGSLEGMAPGVEAALVQALGAERVATLRETGRYRRDVY